jgi:hypothetical protein
VNISAEKAALFLWASMKPFYAGIVKPYTSLDVKERIGKVCVQRHGEHRLQPCFLCSVRMVFYAFLFLVQHKIKIINEIITIINTERFRYIYSYALNMVDALKHQTDYNFTQTQVSDIFVSYIISVGP